jgi:uncharacterized protein
LVTVLITGGTGLVGQFLYQKLASKGYDVRVLTRNPTKKNEFSWNISNNYIDTRALENVDYIIHLAGAGIADKRWSAKRKEELINSRTTSTELLFTKIKELKIPLRGFISASAIGYYGAITSDRIFTETDAPATDFLGKVCKLWEASVLKFNSLKIPTTILRTGIVLSKKGGAFNKMNTPIAIIPIANGKQYLPWIHIEDLTNLYLKAIEDSTFIGIYNAVAPDEQTNFSFSKLVASKTNKLFISIGIPKFILQFLFGEMSIILTTGSRISSKKIEKFGYTFSYKNLNQALDDVIQKS